MTAWLRRRFSGLAILSGLVAAAVLHIGLTLSVPVTAMSTPYGLLRGQHAANRMHVLPLMRAGAQAMAFMGPELRHAICPFDLSTGRLAIKAQLPEAGWALSVIEPSGNIFYSVGGERSRPVNIELLLAPPPEKLLGIWPQNRGPSMDPSLITSTVRTGMLVLSAPVKGPAFAAEVEAQLKAANCELRE